MSSVLSFDPIRLPDECQLLRREARAFLTEQAERGMFDPGTPGGGKAADHKAFARKVAEKGWIGLTWPKRYGGQERSYLERYVLTEEFRVGNAPTRQYFTADRQSGPTLMKYAAEHIKDQILPRIVKGEVQFCIGLSEPNSGSDMFAANTKAVKVDRGWLVNGTKTWTTNGQTADYMIGLFRTSPALADNRRHGLTSFLVDMRTQGISCSPIGQMNGVHDFCEVAFQDVFLPEDGVIGEIDAAWKQATTELAYERSGPERFLETIYLLPALLHRLGATPDRRAAEGVGRLVAQLHTLRRMSVSVSGMLQAGQEPTVSASIVKDLGTIWEQALPSHVRELAAFSDEGDGDALGRLLPYALASAPKYTVAGGTTEVLRGIIARGLGLR
ncbi:MAG: Acyl-CoA dehydrogenase [Bradyrhizobium sp.]|nr:Acyl-CoA dehydrogenase [Bradyrhizobium sp.]